MYLEIARRLEVLLADLEAQPQHGRLEPVLVGAHLQWESHC